MNQHIKNAEKWVELSEAGEPYQINEIGLKTLRWLINKAKLVERMDKALEFYADPKNHEWDIDDPWVGVAHSEVMMDSGEKARKARGTE